jgi:hypothetical protein
MIKPLSKSRLSINRLSDQKDKDETKTEVFNIDSMVPLRVGDLASNVLPEFSVHSDIILNNKY